MGSLAMGHGAQLPQAQPGNGAGAVLSLLAHVLLVTALAWGVNWRTQAPQTLSAELWAAVPQVAAPAAQAVVAPRSIETPPQARPQVRAAEVPDAQIAVEKARQQRELQEQRKLIEQRKRQETLERELRETEKAEKLRSEQELQRQKAEDERLARQREDNLKRMLGQAGATGAPSATGTTQRDAAPSAAYAGRIKARIKPSIVFTENPAGNPEAEVEVRCAPDGTIVGRTLTKRSSSKSYDEAVLRAIDRTELLPRDIDGRVPATMTLAFRFRE